MVLNETQAFEFWKAELRRMTPQEVYKELLRGYYPEAVVLAVLREMAGAVLVGVVASSGGAKPRPPDFE